MWAPWQLKWGKAPKNKTTTTKTSTTNLPVGIMAVNMRKSGKNNSKNLNNKYQQPVDIMAVNMKKSVKNKNNKNINKPTCWHHGSEQEEEHQKQHQNKNNKYQQPVGIMAVNMRNSMQKKSIAALLYTFDASFPVVLIKIMRPFFQSICKKVKVVVHLRRLVPCWVDQETFLINL